MPRPQDVRPLPAPTALEISTHAAHAPPASHRHAPQECNWTLPYGLCTAAERWPGLWEIPLIETEDASGNTATSYTMDPTASTADQLYQLLVTNLLSSYNGGRGAVSQCARAPRRCRLAAWEALPYASTTELLLSYWLVDRSLCAAGNRAPMGVYVHAPWFTAEHTTVRRWTMGGGFVVGCG